MAKYVYFFHFHLDDKVIAGVHKRNHQYFVIIHNKSRNKLHLSRSDVRSTIVSGNLIRESFIIK